MITPDHVIRIKSKWLFSKSLSTNNKESWLNSFSKSLKKYKKDYINYFNKNNKNELTILDTFPRLIFIENIGLYVLGFNEKEINDILFGLLTHCNNFIRP